MNRRVRQNIALQIFDDLMNGHNIAIAFIRLEIQGYKFRLNILKLISPMRAHLVAPANETAFETARPFYVRVHSRDNRFDLASVKSILKILIPTHNFTIRSEDH